MNVVVDSREPKEMIPILEGLGFTTEVRVLDVGDYIIDDKIAITMKSWPDFVESVYSGHMHNEIEDMLKLPNRYMVLLFLWKPKEMGLSQSQIESMEKMANTINIEYISVVRLTGRVECGDAMKRLSEKYDKDLFPLQFRRRVEVAGSNNIDPIIRI